MHMVDLDITNNRELNAEVLNALETVKPKEIESNWSLLRLPVEASSDKCCSPLTTACEGEADRQ